MNSQNPRRSMPGGWSWTNILRDLTATWRLLWDPSVPGILKMTLPFMALAYWVWPIDLMPGLPLDDIAVLMLVARLFVALAPKDSVNRAFNGGDAPFNNYGTNSSNTSGYGAPNSGASKAASPRPEDGEVIDTTWRVVE